MKKAHQLETNRKALTLARLTDFFGRMPARSVISVICGTNVLSKKALSRKRHTGEIVNYLDVFYVQR